MSHRAAKRNRKACRDQMIVAGASSKEAKAELAEAAAGGAQHNFLDLADTREDRRTKTFKKRRYEADIKEASYRDRTAFVNKWNTIFGKAAPDKEKQEAPK